MLKDRYELKTGMNPDKFRIGIETRKLNIRIHNTWKDVAPVRSINLTEPMQDSETEQILEALATIKID